jgi:hypothetical protein
LIAHVAFDSLDVEAIEIFARAASTDKRSHPDSGAQEFTRDRRPHETRRSGDEGDVAGHA